MLEQAGLEVLVVNGKHVKNLPGRKTDIQDCQWLATLHAHGLLRSGFVPPEHIRRLQDYLRLRTDPITLAAGHELHLQKAFERMNVKRHDVISDLTGVSGRKLVRAILAGERDPERLLAWCDPQIQTKKAERVRESLRGTWKEEHLFALRQALAPGSSTNGRLPNVTRPWRACWGSWRGQKILPCPARRRPSQADTTPRRSKICTACCGGCAGARIRPCCRAWPTTPCCK